MRIFHLICIFLPALCIAQDYVFEEYRFRRTVDKALQSVQTILDTTRHPVLLEDAADHTYDDKYALVESMTNTAVAAAVTILKRLGVNDFETLTDWVHNQKRAVTLRFRLKQQCTFDRKTERQVVTAEQEIERSTGGSGLLGRATVETETVKVKHTIHEYHWHVDAPYSLSLEIGSDSIVLDGRDEWETEIVVAGGGGDDTSSRPPAPVSNATKTFDLNLTWLLQMISLDTTDGQLMTQFSIRREAETCRTPSRNTEIEKALEFRNEAGAWVKDILGAFQSLGRASKQENMNEILRPNLDIFSPILPLYENSSVIGEADLDIFLKKHQDALDDAIATIKSSDSSGGLFSHKEKTFIFLLLHQITLLTNWKDIVAYVENMLENQLVQAIGKTIDANDFDGFVSFHSKKMFVEEFAPKPFSYAVRRGNHYPDGVVSIESERFVGGNGQEPVETMSRRIPGGDGAPPIYIPVNAATSVEIRGDRYLHGWIQYQWDNESHIRTNSLVARAHQFSSFMVVLGVMGGSDKFLPKNAIIVQNKDSIVIDLLTNVLPCAKEFKDAISSLSDEQKEFAQAFRGMQLESSVFGVCIIQIKPQLERLLNLPDGSLTKEIQLTQDLMSLFVEYQIPSDLLSFDGSETASVSEKVEGVKGYAKAVMDVIENEKKKQLEEEKQKREMREKLYAPVTQPSAAPTSSPSASANYRRSYGPVAGPSGSDTDELMSDTVQMSAMRIGMQMSEPPPSSSSQNTQKAKSQETIQQNQQSASSPLGDAKTMAEDFTLIPKILDAKLEESDRDGVLKSTTIKAGDRWERSRQENLLVGPTREYLSERNKETEKNQAMDLLTAISRSGSLPIDASELHIIVALTHCFDRDIMRTVIQDNINPIKKVEKSMLLLGSTIQNQPPTNLLAAEQRIELES